MTDLTKLADALDGIGSKATSLTPDQRMEIIEAARILRAAAGVDVAGLMDVADRYALAQADPAHWRSALESDLRLALAAREGFVLVPVEPTREMLNAAIDVDSFKLGDISPIGFRCSPQKLFERCYAAMIAAAPKGTP